MKTKKNPQRAMGTLKKILLATVSLLIINMTLHAQSIQLHCIWTGPDSSITLDYNNGYALVQRTTTRIQIVHIDSLTCMGTVVYETIITNGVDWDHRGYIQSKNDSVVAIVQTQSGLTAIQWNPGGGNNTYYTYPTYSGFWPLQACKTPKGITYLTPYITATYNAELSMGSIPYSGSVVFGAAFPNSFATGYAASTFCSDSNYHYIIGSTSSTSYMLVKTNDALQTTVNTYNIGPVSPGNYLRIFDHQQNDSTITVMMLADINPVPTPLIKRTIKKSDGSYLEASIAYNYNPGIASGIIVDSTTTMFYDAIVRHSPSLSGTLAITDTALFGADLTQSIYTSYIYNSIKSTNCIIWTRSTFGTYPYLNGIKIMLLKHQDMNKVDSLLINGDANQITSGHCTEGNSYILWGASNETDSPAMPYIGGKAKIWITSVNTKFIKLLYQGYYTGASTMASVLANEQVTGATASQVDTITLELRNPTAPYALVSSGKTILQTDGTAFYNFPSSGTYYIVVKHRNGLATWSANPVSMNSTSLTYDFTTAANKAYGNNQIEVSPGIWALYAGDIDQNENIDFSDRSFVEYDISTFQFGYLPTDVNGDGNIDLLDVSLVEGNLINSIFSNHP